MLASDFEAQSAQCRLFASGDAPGFAFAASGLPKFVGASMGGAALGYAIGSEIRMNQKSNDCMIARGWAVTDGKSSEPAMAGSVATSPTSGSDWSKGYA